MSLLTHPFRLVGLVVLGAIVAGAAWIWHGAHSSTPVSNAGALAEFRASGAAPTPARDGVPASGVYRYRASGRERAGGGPLSAERTLPGEAVYVITPRPGGYHEDLRLSQEHVEEAVFAVGAHGASATWRRTKVTFLGIGTDDRHDVRPPSLDHPRPLRPGMRWSGRYQLGDMVVTYSSRATGRGTVRLDGRSVPVVAIETDSSFTGGTHGTRTDVLRYAPSLSLPVAWSIRESTGGATDYSLQADLTLVSATPER